jgi:Domain of unknown function (DUF4430)
VRRVAVALLAALLLAGCGIGPGEEHAGGVSVHVTRDFGHERLGSASTEKIRDSDTVMRLTESNFDVKTRFGGRFVQEIDGLKGTGATGQSDWFFFVNGVESEVGAAEFDLSPGDRVQWDYRRWDTAMRVPAIVGAFPEPFLHGLEGKRRPVRVECDDARSQPCRDGKDALERVHVPVSGSALGAPGTEKVTRLVVALWPKARIVRGGSTLEEGPQASGVFARFADHDTALELLDEEGHVARTVHAGDGTGLVLAMRPRADELVWLVTALDQAGLEAGVRALREDKLRDAFAVAATGRTVEKLPLESP